MTLTVTDDDGGVGTGSVVLTSQNVAPQGVALGGDQTVMSRLEADFERTLNSLHAIRGRELIAGHRFLQGSLSLRNPYVDPLSLLQVSLLRKKRSLPEGHPDLRHIDSALGTTLNGIAQGMRNTG